MMPIRALVSVVGESDVLDISERQGAERAILVDLHPLTQVNELLAPVALDVQISAVGSNGRVTHVADRIHGRWVA